MSYDDGGTARIAWVGYDGTNIMAWRATGDGSNDIGSPTEATALSDDVHVNNETAIMTLGVDGTTLHMLFANSADQDIYYSKSDDDGANWDASTEIEDAITCNFLCGDIYERDGATVFAYLYDDAGATKYNEYALTGTPIAVFMNSYRQRHQFSIG